MPSIHRTAVIEGDVEFAQDVKVGPYCVVLGDCGPIRVGAGCELIASVHLCGPLTLGERNLIYPGATLGFAPQDLGFDPNKAGYGAVVGDQNVFREGFTLHRGKTNQPTRIGNNNFFMGNTHIGHDSVVGNHCVLANGALLGGHVELGDRVLLGGNAGVHQFCRLGRGCMMTGNEGASMDVPMWFMVTATNVAGSLNVVGMRRNGFTPAQIQTVRWVYRMMYRTGRTPQQALEMLEERSTDPIVAEYIAFIRSAKRGVVHGAGRTSRGQGGSRNQTSGAAHPSNSRTHAQALHDWRTCNE